MDADLLKSLGQVAGVGGLAIGVFLMLGREVVRKNIFPMLKKDDAYRLLRLIVICAFSLAIIGLLAWVLVEADIVVGDHIETNGGVTNTGTIDDGTTIDVEQ